VQSELGKRKKEKKFLKKQIKIVGPVGQNLNIIGYPVLIAVNFDDTFAKKKNWVNAGF